MTNETHVRQVLSDADAVAAEALRSRALARENSVLWTLWLTYGAFYFCRTNLSAAVPGMNSPV
ncbi:MAG: hypothetical protein IAG10_12730, partial [Planctomycetaceae bacterium]|nr:hypothetical protein [Planctomycetaceae bacterium]